MTIQEKLKKFHDKRVGILVDSEEKAKELARVLDEGDFEDSEGSTWERVISTAWGLFGNTGELYVIYNYYLRRNHRSSYGTINNSGDDLEILEVTLEELRSV